MCLSLSRYGLLVVCGQTRMAFTKDGDAGNGSPYKDLGEKNS